MRSASQALAAPSKALAAPAVSRRLMACRKRGPHVSCATAAAPSRLRSRPLLASPTRGLRGRRV
eukprot:5281399-Lingulodinium_polyedra.AAC.1